MPVRCPGLVQEWRRRELVAAIASFPSLAA
jgi:hypothetical protein